MLFRHLPPSTFQCTTALLAVCKSGTRASLAACGSFPRRLLLKFIFIQHDLLRNISCRRPYPQALHMQTFPPRTCIEPGLSSPPPVGAHSQPHPPAVWRLRCPGESAPGNIQPQSFGRRAVIRATGTFGYEFAGAVPTWRRCSGEVFGRLRLSQPAEAGLSQSTGPNRDCQIGPVGS